MTSLVQAGREFGSRYFISLQYPEYRKLWLATLCSQSSAWAMIVARAALILQLTGSATWTGAVTFAAMIPSVMVSPLAGYLADRFDRRTVLIYAYSVNLVHNALLSVLAVTGAIEAWHLVVLAVINGSARYTQMPSAQALLPNTLPRERLFNAVTLFGVTQHGSRFVGPFLILVVLWATGPLDLLASQPEAWAFLLCTSLYCPGLGLIVSIRTASRGAVEAGRSMGVILGGVVEGLRYMYHHPLVLSLVLLVVAHCGMTMSFESLFPVLSRDRLGLNDSASILGGFSYLMVGYGAAALVAALTLAGVQTESARGRLLLWLGILSGATPLALTMSPNLPLVMASAAAMGFSQGGFMVLSQAMVQAIVPDSIRGRLLGVYSWHTSGFMAGFNLVNGTIVGFTALSAGVTLAAGGIGFLIVITLSFARVPLRRLYARGVPAT